MYVLPLPRGTNTRRPPEPAPLLVALHAPAVQDRHHRPLPGLRHEPRPGHVALNVRVELEEAENLRAVLRLERVRVVSPPRRRKVCTVPLEGPAGQVAHQDLPRQHPAGVVEPVHAAQVIDLASLLRLVRLGLHQDRNSASGSAFTGAGAALTLALVAGVNPKSPSAARVALCAVVFSTVPAFRFRCTRSDIATR